jgi:hypothetical protein
MQALTYYSDPLRWIQQGRSISALVIPPPRDYWRLTHNRDVQRSTVLMRTCIASQNWDLFRPKSDRS